MTATRIRRLIATSAAFLCFELVLLLVLDVFFDYDSLAAATVVFAIGSVGYLGLGYFGRSWLTLPVATIPIVVAVAADVPSSVTNLDGQPVPPMLSTVFLAAISLPVWALGLLLAERASDRRRESR